MLRKMKEKKANKTVTYCKEFECLLSSDCHDRNKKDAND